MPALRFEYIPYPLWRRRMPMPLKPLARALLRHIYPLDAEAHPPQTAAAQAAYLRRCRLLPLGMTQSEAETLLERESVHVEAPREAQPDAHARPVRLPAQWEPLERVLLAFPVLYPPLWAQHARMIAAISHTAAVTVLLPSAAWARVIAVYLRMHHAFRAERIEWLLLPTDDIWIRDYGPFVGFDAQGQRAAVDAVYQPLAQYPQTRDDAAAGVWAAYAGLPSRRFDFATEGGNYWSDGAGTLLVSDEMLVRYPQLSIAEIERRLREVFIFDKLIMLPRLLMEETGHVDLVCKLIDAETVLVSAPSGGINDDRLRTAAALLRRETNARGQRYRVHLLPMPPMQRNWWVYPVWRSYTNSLTVNGRILVPVFGIGQDMQALDVYRQAAPKQEIIPIDCRAGAYGGGAVHCLTREIPAADG